MKLRGKVALVTGASRGIGRAIAVGLAAEGAQVAINYVSRPDAALAVQEAIGVLGQEGLPVQADVAVAADVERMVGQVLDRFGQIDVLVHNATLHRGRRVHRLPESDWDAVLDSCLKGAYHCCQHVVPHIGDDAADGAEDCRCRRGRAGAVPALAPWLGPGRGDRRPVCRPAVL